MKNGKKSLIILICLFLFPCMVNAVETSGTSCPTESIDTTKYQYNGRVTGGNASTYVENNYPTPNYVSTCCTINNVYTCDVYKLKETNNGETNDNSNSETNGETNTSGSIDYCTGLKSTFIIIGHVVNIAKIFIPIIIIGLGIMDFFKAIIASKDDEIKKSSKSLIMRTIAGVVVFFIPVFIELVFSWVSGWSENYEKQYQECFKCIWDVNSCK